MTKGEGNTVQEFQHETVLLNETVQAVLPHDAGLYIDCTLGGGGHTALLLEQSAPAGRVLSFDQDDTALQHAKERFVLLDSRVTLVHSNFRDVARVATEHGFTSVDGIVFDLGVSSPQLDAGERGFSYRHDAPLDMRMDVSVGETAAHLVKTATEEELVDIFFRYGEEKFSRRIAKSLVEVRKTVAIETTEQLADLVKYAIPAAARRTGPHPARRVFQALRIAVNDELGALTEALRGAWSVLNPKGRMAVITFHSLEDRIVKQTFAEWARGCTCPPQFPVCQCYREPEGKVITRKPLVATDEEVLHNPRARSAKLRIVEKL